MCAWHVVVGEEWEGVVTEMLMYETSSMRQPTLNFFETRFKHSSSKFNVRFWDRFKEEKCYATLENSYDDYVTSENLFENCVT